MARQELEKANGTRAPAVLDRLRKSLEQHGTLHVLQHAIELPLKFRLPSGRV